MPGVAFAIVGGLLLAAAIRGEGWWIFDNTVIIILTAVAIYSALEYMIRDLLIQLIAVWQHGR